jgi:YfiH family protein
LGTPIGLPGRARVLFTTRADGNLSARVGDGADRAERAREELRARLGLAELRSTRQVHGAVVRLIDDPPPRGEAPEPDGRAPGAQHTAAAASAPSAGDVEADGQVTALTGVGLMALTADCLPVALASERGVAMLHAGWRGLAGGVLEQGVRVLRSLGEGAITAVVGPGAGPCCYEVGPEVHAALGGARSERRPIDLKAVAARRLEGAGVELVHDAGICTICDTRLYSHRREGTRSGRLGGIVWRARP